VGQVGYGGSGRRPEAPRPGPRAQGRFHSDRTRQVAARQQGGRRSSNTRATAAKVLLKQSRDRIRGCGRRPCRTVPHRAAPLSSSAARVACGGAGAGRSRLPPQFPSPRGGSPPEGRGAKRQQGSAHAACVPAHMHAALACAPPRLRKRKRMQGLHGPRPPGAACTAPLIYGACGKRPCFPDHEQASQPASQPASSHIHPPP
jgi:hypothetical protein